MTIKSSKRHTRKKLTLATAVLLEYVIKKHGGIREVARRIGHSPQLINVWIQMGHIPLKHVGRIASKLGEPPEVFNYEGVVSLFSQIPFAHVVKEIVLDEVTRKKILTSELPRDREKLLA